MKGLHVSIMIQVRIQSFLEGHLNQGILPLKGSLFKMPLNCLNLTTLFNNYLSTRTSQIKPHLCTVGFAL